MSNISLYGQYIKEKIGRGILETEDGFATFEYPTSEVVYIVDLYVKPEKRKSRVAATLADKIVEEAIKSGRKYLLGSVDLGLKSAEESVKVLLAYGMTLHKEAKPMVFFIKQIAEVPEQDAINQTLQVIEQDRLVAE